MTFTDVEHSNVKIPFFEQYYALVAYRFHFDDIYVKFKNLMFLQKKIVDTKTIGRRNAKNSRTLFLLLLSLQKTRNSFLGVLLNSLRFFFVCS